MNATLRMYFGGSQERTTLDTALQAFGSVTGMLGSYMLANKVFGFEFAYIFYFLSSASMTYYFFKRQMGWFMLQQGFFTVINIQGLYYWTWPALQHSF